MTAVSTDALTPSARNLTPGALAARRAICGFSRRDVAALTEMSAREVFLCEEGLRPVSPIQVERLVGSRHS
jgi:hypothetical protein